MILYKWQLPGALRSGMVLTVKTIDELTKEFGSLDGVPGGLPQRCAYIVDTNFV